MHSLFNLQALLLLSIASTAVFANYDIDDYYYDYSDYYTSTAAPPEPGKPEKPEKPTTTTTTTTRRTTTTTVNVHPNPSINLMCPSNPGMNDRIREKALQMHNFRRRRLAQGEVTKFNGNKFHPATNMLALEYDCALETSARLSANRCSTNPSSTPSNVQENLAQFSQSAYQFRVDAIEAAIKKWWKTYNDIGLLVTYKPHHVGAPVSQFTRMAWATTKRIGCAVTLKNKCSGQWTVVCHYREGGNILGATVYTTGNTCSACPGGTRCENSLCV